MARRDAGGNLSPRCVRGAKDAGIMSLLGLSCYAYTRRTA